MNIGKLHAAAALFGAALASGCQVWPTVNPNVTQARADLDALKSDPQLANRAPAAVADADNAVRVAEQAWTRSDENAGHLGYIADRKVGIARAEAEDRLASDQMTALAQQRDDLQVAARERQAEFARNEVEQARRDAYYSQAQAQSARQQADIAMMEANDYKQQLQDLQAQQTDRGMVVTLGDLLFATGRANLPAGNQSRLQKLALFLDKNPDRTVIIEGHTDNVGSEQTNQRLSLRRAEAVRSYLVANGVSADRIKAVGKGEDEPVADNGDAAGRQQNRRVEVIIQTAS
ncbi:MAG TPA: OmpA family protein [Nevskiaceae bacterium]|nr:OmpA family protein [Nevskiaceae bacterium]